MSAKKAFSELQARRHPASVFWNFLNLKWFGLEERKEELLMRESALFVAAALAVFHPAVAKVVHRRPVHARAPSVHQGRPYGYSDRPKLPNDDCDGTNKVPLTTCANGR
jgi:hypothetical protein